MFSTGGVPAQVYPQGPGTPPLVPGTPPGAVHAGRYGQQAGGTHLYCPQTKFAKVMFLQVSVCPQGGMHGCWGGVHGCSRGREGECVHGCSGGGPAWLLGGGCHAWLLQGQGFHAWLLWGGGLHGCSGGGPAWLLWGGMRGIR